MPTPPPIAALERAVLVHMAASLPLSTDPVVLREDEEPPADAARAFARLLGVRLAPVRSHLGDTAYAGRCTVSVRVTANTAVTGADWNAAQKAAARVMAALHRAGINGTDTESGLTLAPSFTAALEDASAVPLPDDDEHRGHRSVLVSVVGMVVGM